VVHVQTSRSIGQPTNSFGVDRLLSLSLLLFIEKGDILKSDGSPYLSAFNAVKSNSFNTTGRNGQVFDMKGGKRVKVIKVGNKAFILRPITNRSERK